jgi:hypothetical protein
VCHAEFNKAIPYFSQLDIFSANSSVTTCRPGSRNGRLFCPGSAPLSFARSGHSVGQRSFRVRVGGMYRWSMHIKFHCPNCDQDHERMMIVQADTEKAAGEQAAKEPQTCDTYQTPITKSVPLLISAHTGDRRPFPQKSSNSESDR